MSDEYLTTVLAVRVMCWRMAAGRYLKPEGGWVSRSGFRPLVITDDAFRIIEAVTDDYSLEARPGYGFVARARLAGRVGSATADTKARAITLAVARVLGIHTESPK